MAKPRIVLTFAAHGKGSGPYISHRRIMESELNDKYTFVPVYLPHIRKLLGISGMITLIKELKDAHADIVHMEGLQLTGYFTMVACRFANVKRTLVAVHGSSTASMCISPWERKIYRWLEEDTLKHATRFYGVSDAILRLPSLRRFDRKNAGRIYNMAPLEKAGEGTLRAAYDIDKGDIVVATTARIVQEKGFPYLAEAIGKMSVRRNLWFVIVGEGNYLAQMKMKVRGFPNHDRVLFLGYRSDVLQILSDTDIFVMPSLHETLGISLIEAGYMGIPSVASKVGGILEVIEDQVSGILVSPADSEALAAAITYLADHPEIRSAMGKEAKRIVEEKFDPSTISRQIDALYKDMLGESGFKRG
jgi:glycosyltransferase involved in cell wall biosynthesis